MALGYNAGYAAIPQPVTPEQVAAANSGAGMTADQMAAFASQVGANGGLGLQNAAYSGGHDLEHNLSGLGSVGLQGQALQAGQGISNQMAANNGVGNQGSVFGQMQGTAKDLQAAANGQGPNPALAQLANTTGQNVAAQSAMMAGQRGGSANAGLLARQAAQTGAATQQNAVGQAAALSAQQQIAARQALQNQQANMAGLANTQVGQQMGMNAQNYGNAANTTGQLMNQGQNQFANASNMVNQSQNSLGAANQAALGYQQNMGSQLGNQTNANVNMQGNVNSANANVYGAQLGAAKDLFGGLANGAGSLFSNMTTGDKGVGIGGPKSGPSTLDTSDMGSGTGMISDAYGNSSGTSGDVNAGGIEGLDSGTMTAAHGGLIPKYAQGGPVSMVGKHLAGIKMAKGGMSQPVIGEQLAARGQLVPGKAAVKGDSYKNDTVDAKLSPGEIVIPRHIVNSKDPAAAAAKFVAAVLAKKRHA